MEDLARTSLRLTIEATRTARDNAGRVSQRLELNGAEKPALEMALLGSRLDIVLRDLLAVDKLLANHPPEQEAG